jgi:nitrous oxidase accessory protein NosD
MTEDRSRALVPQVPGSISVVSRLAERTLAERSARSDALAVVGRTLVVGSGGYATIAEAVALAQDGDRVLVRPGTYRESVTVTRAITLLGDGDRGDIVIEFDGAPCLILERSTSRVSKLTIRGGGPHGPAWTSAAILVDGGSPTLDGLSVADSRGISVEGGAVGIIRGCAIGRGRLGGSIMIREGATTLIEKNEIFGNAGVGIGLMGDGTAPLIQWNLIHDCGSGISVGFGARGRIENNEIYDNSGSGSGIDINDVGTVPLVRGNLIYRCSNGISVDFGATGTIEANEIFRNAGSGIVVQGPGTAPRIRANRIYHCGLNGIGIGETAAGMIEGNEVFGNTQHGILIRDPGTAPLVRANDIHDGLSCGISVCYGAGGQVIDNKIRGNRGQAIRTEPGTSPQLLGNVVQ